MGVAVAQPIPFLDINGRRYQAIPNPSLLNKDGTKKSALDHVVEYTKTANGAFRCLQFLERVTKAVVLVLKEMGSSMVAFFEKLAGGFGLAWAMLTIPRLPEVTKAAKKAIVEWITPPREAPVDGKRDKVEKLHQIADVAAAWGYAGSLVAGSMAIKNMADVPNLISDVTDLQMAAQDWRLSKEHVKIIDAQDPNEGPVHDRFVYTMRLALIKMVKAISSVVSGVLGLMVLALGGPVLPAAVLLGISLISTISAVSAHFFQETMPFEKVDFFKSVRNPEVLVAGA